jgi:Tol biopolymer transport system component
MAAALEEAHQKLVVHRDFKPGNVKIKPDGTVKVLDFGLAKLPVVQTAASANAGDAPTLTIATTQARVLLGTAAYMSPEQARGEPVDKRSDVWAFGVVLWEMLTGKRLFQGTASDVLAAVIRDEPDLSQVAAKVRPLLKRCLEKDAKRRLRDIGDAMGIIEDTPEPRPASSWLVWALAAVAAAFLVTAGAVSFVHFREMVPEARVITTSVEPPENTSFDFGGFNPPALSPDGRRIVFRASGADGKKTQFWVRPVDSPAAAQPLLGTEGATFPFWSPDSRSIAFFAAGKLKRMQVPSGPVLTLADAPSAFGGSWSWEDVIVFAPITAGALQRVIASGGMPLAATTVDPRHDYAHYLPWFLPDGHHFLFSDQTQPGHSQVMLRIGDVNSHEVKTVGPASSNAVYSSGYLLYKWENALMAQPFNEKRLAITAGAAPLAEQVQTGVFGIRRMAILSVARQGLMAYLAGAVGSQQLMWFDRSGKPLGTVGEAGDFFSVEFSVDRKSVGVTRPGQNEDIWIYDATRGLATRFTYSSAAERFPVWSPDGRSIAYSSNAKGPFDLYRKAADGTGGEELLYADGANKFVTSWSADGKFLLYFRVDPKTGQDIWVLPVGRPSEPSAPSKPFPWLATPFHEGFAKFSPDGQWVAYQSDESGQYEIYVAPFPGPGRKRQISTGGGAFGRWRADGKEIFYVNGMLMATQISIKGGSIEVGAVRSLGIAVPTPPCRYDASADGQRFLVASPREQKPAMNLTLVENWTTLLKK